jgi:3'-5' exoribonuclease
MKISHMISGVMALMEFKDAIEDLMGNDFFESLVSVISQHSGEYGERPRTVAAYVVHLIDTLESRLASLEEVAGNTAQLMFEGFRLN